MAFLRISGRANEIPVPYKASTALAANAAIGYDGSGNVIAAAATTAATAAVVGVTAKARAATDADYASLTYYPVDVALQDDVFLADVLTGTASAANVGVAYELSGSAGLGVSVSGTTHPSVLCVGFIDATHLLVKFKSIDFVNPA